MSVERIGRIRAALERELAPRSLDIEDDSARHAGHAGAREGGHFRVRVVADSFRGKSRIERHRLVFAALEGFFGSDIHALNIEALAPEENS